MKNHKLTRKRVSGAMLRKGRHRVEAQALRQQMAESTPCGDDIPASILKLSERFRDYIGVRGIFIRHDCDETDLLIIADKPMFKPLTLLASAWAERLASVDERRNWSVCVTPHTPSSSSGYLPFYSDAEG